MAVMAVMAVMARLDALEGRLEAAEMEQLGLKEELRRVGERSEGLRADLQAERARSVGIGEQPGQRGPAWRRVAGRPADEGLTHRPTLEA